MVNIPGKLLGVNKNGYKIFKNVIREDGNKVYDNTKTYLTYVNKEGKVEKVLERNVVSKSDIHKKGTVPHSTWQNLGVKNGTYSETRYYPRAITKYQTFPHGGYMSQDLVLSKDGKYVDNYMKQTSAYNAGITYGNPKQGRWDSRSGDLASVNEPKCEWTSLADYNQKNPYYQFK